MGNSEVSYEWIRICYEKLERQGFGSIACNPYDYASYVKKLLIFQPGFKYSKAEVLLLDLRQPGEFSDDLFADNQPAEASKVMAVLNEINGRRGTLRAASKPSKPSKPNWCIPGK